MATQVERAAVPFGQPEVAVLFRINAQSERFEEALAIQRKLIARAFPRPPLDEGAEVVDERADGAELEDLLAAGISGCNWFKCWQFENNVSSLRTYGTAALV